jgi:deoxyribose-phosphate aldolase
MQLANFIDHTLLKPTATLYDIKELCKEAITHQFYAVCVNPCHIALTKKELAKTNIKIAAVVGFPLGSNTTEVKVNEAIECIANGADEIDMVINIGWLKTAKYIEVEQEIGQIKRAIGTKLLKVIIECCYLTQEEIKMACQLAINAKADFVKTSTGYGTGGATFEDVCLMKEVVGNQIKIKASGGIKDRETAMNYIELGVTRIGTSSGIDIINTLN